MSDCKLFFPEKGHCPVCDAWFKPKIVTSHIYPPISIRRFDWCAHREGEEERGHYGWGPTAEAAIADLLENEEMER